MKYYTYPIGSHTPQEITKEEKIKEVHHKVSFLERAININSIPALKKKLEEAQEELDFLKKD